MDKELYYTSVDFCDNAMLLSKEHNFSVIGSYSIIKDIFELLVRDLSVCDITFRHNYEGDYVLYVDDEYKIHIHPTKIGNAKFVELPKTKYCWIHSDSNSGVIKFNPELNFIEFEYVDFDPAYISKLFVRIGRKAMRLV